MQDFVLLFEVGICFQGASSFCTIAIDRHQSEEEIAFNGIVAVVVCGYSVDIKHARVFDF